MRTLTLNPKGMLKGRPWVLAWLVLWCSPGWTGEEGGLEGQFLNWGGGARAMSLGRAYVAIADDATASYWNPAGLAQVDHWGVSALHAALWEGITYDFVSVAVPTVGDGAFGLNTAMLSVGGADRRDADNVLLEGEVRSTKLATTVGYARAIGGLGQFGISITYLSRSLDQAQTGFLSAHVGWLGRVWPDLRIGAVIQHVAQVRFGDSEDQLPLLVKFGAAYRLMDGVLLALDVEQNGRWHLGTELSPAAPFALRAGADDLEMTVGAGVVFQQFGLDYSAGLHQFLGLSHRVSFQVQWGDSTTAVRMAQARAAYFAAVEAMGKGEREVALSAARAALDLDPANDSAAWLVDHLTQGR